MRGPLAILVASGFGVTGLGACKTDDAKPASPVPAHIPKAPTAVPADARDVFDLDRLRALEPRFVESTPMKPLALIEERGQAIQSWCMAGSDARAIADAMNAALTTAGWTEINARGTPDRAGASATRDGVRLSITIGGLDAACAGRVATAMYTGSTFTIPPLEEGERIR